MTKDTHFRTALWTTRYNRWIDNKDYEDVQRIGEDYWYYAEVRDATKTDEDRICPWCSVVPAGGRGSAVERSYREHDGDERNFKKGEIIVREQFSQTSFKTYHPRCFVLKLREVQLEFKEGLDFLTHYVRTGELV
tara:strand:- start:407 stop:811 length:405 start_codon:yes stop_codon:yes gene_type:complete